MSETVARRAWSPEANLEVAAVLRLLMVRPWLIARRDDDAIAAVRRNADAARSVFARLGWVLVVERDLVRLRKSPPCRRGPYVSTGPQRRSWQWFFLLAAAAESMGRRVALGQLVTAARAAAGDAGVSVTNDIAERRAVVAALKMLTARGVIEELDGDVEGYAHDDDPPVLLAIHHTRLLHLVANYSPEHDPVDEPEAWLAAVEREPDAARRMRRRLVNDAAVYTADLDDTEADWLRRRLRGDDGGPLADAFGLHIERRSEGAAFVVPETAYRHAWELGPFPFPASGTVPHAALLVCNWVAVHASPADAAGWRRTTRAAVAEHLTALAADSSAGTAGWSRDLASEAAGRLCDEVGQLLSGLDVARITGDEWAFSPVIARWPAPIARRPRPKASAPTEPSFDFGDTDDTDLALRTCRTRR